MPYCEAVTHPGDQLPSAASRRRSSPIPAALAALGALVAVVATFLPALATDTGARLSVWDARRLDGLMGALWVLQAAVVVLTATAALLLLRRSRRITTPLVGVTLLAAGVASVIVVVQLLTFPRDIGDPPLEPAGGLIAAGGQVILIGLAGAATLWRSERRRRT